MSLPCLRKTVAGVELFLYIQPRASRNQIVGLHGEELKVALTAPPVDGVANKACSVFLAKLCGLPKSRVQLVSGQTSRHKRFLLHEADFSQIAMLLENVVGA